MPTTEQTGPQALSGLVVLDLTRVLAGPWATQNLADLGATVIKVERPNIGDESRGWGPPFMGSPDGTRNEASYFLSSNRGKRSITVNLDHPEGQALIKELACLADVVVENYKVGGLTRYGLDYSALSKLNHRLIYCSITGFGQTGPYAARAGYDFLMQGMAGIMSVTGERDELPGGGPQKAGIPITDLATGLYAVSAILAALHQRNRTGKGQHIDIALLDVGVALMSSQAMHYFATGDAPLSAGNGHNSIVPYQSFPSLDGRVIIAAANDGQFKRLAVALGRPEWSRDERFVTNAARVANRDLVTGLIAGETAEHSTEALVNALEAVAVPCGYVNNVRQTFEDAQVKARNLRRTIEPSGFPCVASPLRMSGSPVQYDMPPPSLGEHTREILSGLLGMSSSAIAELEAAGAI